MELLIRCAVLSGLWLVGCAPTPQIGSNTRPDDLSAGGHRSEAAAHAEEARLDSREGHGSSRADTVSESTGHDDALRQRSEAQTHLNDAAILERAVQTECATFPAAERPQCGFGGRQVTSVEDLPDGARIRFAAGGPAAAATLTRVRCTHAYADFAGRNTMPACVVAIRDLSIAAGDDNGAVVLTLTTSDVPSVAELRRRAHAITQPATPTGR